MNPIQLHKEVIEQIIEQEYYYSRFINLVVQEYPETLIEDEQNLEKICAFWNKFWFILPDSPAIRCPLFFRICDLAEGGYLEPQSEEDV